MGGEFLRGEFFLGASFAEKKKKQNQKIRPKNSGPEFGRPKFVSQNSALNSGSSGAKSPVQKFVPDTLGRESLNGGLANGGLRYLCTIVHECLRLSSFCDENFP